MCPREPRGLAASAGHKIVSSLLFTILRNSLLLVINDSVYESMDTYVTSYNSV
jgi:hypothetical protein